MNSSSDFKKILFSLREKELIDENYFVQALDGLKSSSKMDQNHLTPLLDMYGIKLIDNKLQILTQSILITETKMKDTIQAWETKKLSKEETKVLLTDLVLQKNKLNQNQEILRLSIQAKVTRLKSLKKATSFDLEQYISLLHQTADTQEVIDLIIDFKTIWAKYSKEDFGDEVAKERPQRLDEFELEILRSLMVPIPKNERIIFDLEEIIQPMDQNNFFQSSLSDYKKTDAVGSNNGYNEVQEPVQEKLMRSPWDLVGSIAYSPGKMPIGFFRPPIVVDETIFLPIVREKSLTVSTIKETYQDILKQVGLDLKIITTEEIRTKIAGALKVPDGFALQPSFFNQWICDLGLEIIPAKPQLKNIRFVDIESVDTSSPGAPTVKEEELRKVQISAWIPASGENISEPQHIGQRVIGMAGSDFGLIVGIMYETPFGQSLVIERTVPPSYLLDVYLEGLGKENLAELRFSFAKKLKIGEGDAFFAPSLWTINNLERLLISPHEIATSYYTVLPAAAFTFSEKIKAKIGVYFHSVPETFRYLIGKPLVITEEETGLIYGFSVNQGEMNILWSPKDPVNIIKELGRKSSRQYVHRLQRRISLALGIPYEESLWPSNLARYFMNFIWMEEQLSLEKALSTIEERFSLQRISFSKITQIKKDGLKC
ncbi:MAG: hypothetical protein ACFFB2_06080 [Promethearchaeota archaeon]